MNSEDGQKAMAYSVPNARDMFLLFDLCVCIYHIIPLKNSAELSIIFTRFFVKRKEPSTQLNATEGRRKRAVGRTVSLASPGLAIVGGKKHREPPAAGEDVGQAAHLLPAHVPSQGLAWTCIASNPSSCPSKCLI